MINWLFEIFDPFFIISLIIAVIDVDKLYVFVLLSSSSVNELWCIPITVESSLKITGEPDDPCKVEQLWEKLSWL